MKSPYSEKRIAEIFNSPAPRVLLNVCTHGNERVGLGVASHFRKVHLRKGTFVINVANKKAVAENKRFIKDDLNRVFPGKKTGSYEEKLAYKMTPFIKAFDLVIDIHSTETGLSSSIIVTNKSAKLKRIIQEIGPKRLIQMSATKSNALISVAKLGLAFEYGKDKDRKTLSQTIDGIEKILKYYEMLEKTSKNLKKEKTEFFEAFSTLEKPEGFVVAKQIENFKFVKKGSRVGIHPGTKVEIKAPQSFYPILFGKNSYTKIFGFMAKKRPF